MEVNGDALVENTAWFLKGRVPEHFDINLTIWHRVVQNQQLCYKAFSGTLLPLVDADF